MLSPSRGFCCCFPVKVGALVVCLLSFVGSGILAGITINSLTSELFSESIPERISPSHSYLHAYNPDSDGWTLFDVSFMGCSNFLFSPWVRGVSVTQLNRAEDTGTPPGSFL